MPLLQGVMRLRVVEQEAPLLTRMADGSFPSTPEAAFSAFGDASGTDFSWEKF